VSRRQDEFRIDAVIGMAGLWHWVCRCGAKDRRWYRGSADALTAGSGHDCRDCCDAETLARLAEPPR